MHLISHFTFQRADICSQNKAELYLFHSGAEIWGKNRTEPFKAKPSSHEPVSQFRKTLNTVELWRAASFVLWVGPSHLSLLSLLTPYRLSSVPGFFVVLLLSGFTLKGFGFSMWLSWFFSTYCHNTSRSDCTKSYTNGKHGNSISTWELNSSAEVRDKPYQVPSRFSDSPLFFSAIEHHCSYSFILSFNLFCFIGFNYVLNN